MSEKLSWVEQAFTSVDRAENQYYPSLSSDPIQTTEYRKKKKQICRELIIFSVSFEVFNEIRWH